MANLFSSGTGTVYLASELLCFYSKCNSQTHTQRSAQLIYSLNILMTNRLVRRVYAADLVISHRHALYTKPTNHEKLPETWKSS